MTIVTFSDCANCTRSLVSTATGHVHRHNGRDHCYTTSGDRVAARPKDTAKS